MSDKDNTVEEENHAAQQPYGFYAHEDLCEALSHGQDEHLCTSGEYLIIDAFIRLPIEEQRIYAQLLTREKNIFRLDTLITSPMIAEEHLHSLLESIFFVSIPLSQSPMQFHFYSKKELFQLCKVYGKKKTGKKEDLVARLLSTSASPPPLIKNCYKELFSRFFRKLYLQHSTNWSHPVVMRLKDVAVYPYETTKRAIHTTRNDFREYRLFYTLYRTKQPYIDFGTPNTTPNIPYRFQGYRFYRKYIYACAERSETSNPRHSHQLYQSILPHTPSLLRMLVLFRSHPNINDLYHRTKKRIITSTLEESLTLYKSLGPLCRHHKLRKGLPPQILEPITRTLSVAPCAKGPLFSIKDKQFHIEEFIIQLIQQQEQMAFFAENHFWRTLKTILFLPVFYSKTTSQLPSPFQYTPLDIHSPLFYERRKQECDRILDNIRDGKARSLFHEQRPSDHQLILGQSLHNINCTMYELFLDHVDADALANIMCTLLKHPKASGMPDIVMFTTETFQCPMLIPSSIRTSMTFIEAKSQSDTLRPNQRAMHHLLLSNGICVEIWKQKKP